MLHCRVMSQLGLFIVTVCSAVFSYQLLAYPLIYLAIVRRNPFPSTVAFFRPG